MDLWKLIGCILCTTLAAEESGYYSASNRNAARSLTLELSKLNSSATGATASERTERALAVLARYKLDASESQFIVRSFSAGLLFLMGRDHFARIREFTGEIDSTPCAICPASLRVTARLDSLEETRDVFTAQQKQIINRELRDIVLEVVKNPEISFSGADVAGNISGSQCRARISGDFSLHGVTRHHIVTPEKVTLTGNTLRTRGAFKVEAREYNIKARLLKQAPFASGTT
jgi:polyisoprenoid-binding protein YceI